MSGGFDVAAQLCLSSVFGKNTVKSLSNPETAHRVKQMAIRMAQKVPSELLASSETPITLVRNLASYTADEVRKNTCFLEENQAWIVNLAIELWPDRVPGAYELGESFVIFDKSVDCSLSKSGDKPTASARWAVSQGSALKELLGRLRALRRKAKGSQSDALRAMKSKLSVKKTYNDGRATLEALLSGDGLDSEKGSWLLGAKANEPKDPAQQELYWKRLAEIFLGDWCDEQPSPEESPHGVLLDDTQPFDILDDCFVEAQRQQQTLIFFLYLKKNDTFAGLSSPFCRNMTYICLQLL